MSCHQSVHPHVGSGVRSPVEGVQPLPLPLVAVLLFATSFLLFCARNLDPVAFPTVYAEDGLWSALILDKGWLHAAFQARNFPVLGIVGPMEAGLLLVQHLWDGDLGRLPLVYFIISNAFFASLATLAFFAPARYLSATARAVLWMVVVFVPVGPVGNELFGRLLNIVYLYPVFQYLLFADIVAGEASVGRLIAACLMGLVAGLTFPVCIAFNLLVLALLVWRWWRDGRAASRMTRGAVAGLLLIVAVNLLLLPADALTSKGGAEYPYNPAGLIEFVLARMVLYPFMSNWYLDMSDVAMVGGALLLAAAAAAGFLFLLRHRSRTEQTHAVFVWACFLLYLLAMAVMRNGFTSFYGAYKGTFADRYFIGINILGAFSVVVLADLLPRVGRVASGLAGCVLAVNAIGVQLSTKQIVELDRPSMVWREMGTFQSTLCGMARGEGPLPYDPAASMVMLPIYPKLPDYPWRIPVPKPAFDQARMHCSAAP